MSEVCNAKRVDKELRSWIILWTWLAAAAARQNLIHIYGKAPNDTHEKGREWKQCNWKHIQSWARITIKCQSEVKCGKLVTLNFRSISRSLHVVSRTVLNFSSFFSCYFVACLLTIFHLLILHRSPTQSQTSHTRQVNTKNMSLCNLIVFGDQQSAKCCTT